MSVADSLARARRYIAGGASTLSKRPRAFVEGSSPVAFDFAYGASVAANGRLYRDWSQGLGCSVLGAVPRAVTDAVCNVLWSGNLATLPSIHEADAAEALIAATPYADSDAMCRWLNSGTEACLAAQRIARRATGNHWIVSSGYHGWAESFMCLQPVTDGIPPQYQQMTVGFEWGDWQSLDAALDYCDRHSGGTVAAVILEPAIYDEPPAGYIQAVADMAHEAGALLIADMVVCGFRHPDDLVLQGVVPDLAVYGKAIGAGVYPVAAVLGRADIMQHSACISGTFCGSNGACAAVMSTMQFYSEHDVRGHIWRIGSRLKGGINALGHPLQLQGMPPRMRMTWDDKGDDWPHLSIVVEQLADRGIHVACGGVLPSYAHTEADADAFIAAVDEACKAIAAGAQLRGLPIEPAFQRDPGRAT